MYIPTGTCQCSRVGFKLVNSLHFLRGESSPVPNVIPCSSNTLERNYLSITVPPFSPTNSGPSLFNVLSFNARSLLPKVDELLVLASVHKPKIICITESWMYHEISDEEISIPGFQLLRKDRNRHGGGVAINLRIGCITM